ncbi:lipoprotein LprG [Amycolatopsis pretoriensis]|uniref:Lipoprotein LprG n=1 Tax=Amycolatopsis pretoriensis TaxID=218821 RepID=A0A1H5QNN2_9PSEU|nr:lipoprotein LprG [Amycolatopsis pretoriensis]
MQAIDGDFTRTGDAKGTGKIAVSGQIAEIEFVLLQGSLYLKGPTGGYQLLPQSAADGVYDPRVILDPAKGLPNLLTTVADPKTVGNEVVNGTQATKITGTVTKEQLSSLLPGVPTGADATFWLLPDTKYLPAKVSLTFPGNISADMSLSDIDKPFAVTPPV